MNDTFAAVRDRMRDSLADVRMPVTADQITARGTRRRTHRRVAGLAAACVIAGTAAGAAVLTGPAGQSSGRSGVHVHLAAWSVDTNTDGTVTLTVHELWHADDLRAALARAGVPAVVTPGQSCLDPRNQSRLFHSAVLGKDGLTIRPSAIPPGDKLLISLPTAPDGSVVGYGWGLTSPGEQLRCSDMSNVVFTPVTSMPPWFAHAKGNR